MDYGFDYCILFVEWTEQLNIMVLTYNNHFAKAMKKQLDQGRKAQFSMLVKARNLDLPIDIQCKLFEAVVFPTLLYGCEVWGFQNIDMLELLFRNFFFRIETFNTKLHSVWRGWKVTVTD